MTDQQIAIIGSGVSGISIVKFLTEDERFNEHIKLDIYDEPDTMGRGYAYREDSADLIINIPTEEMSLISDAADFKNWLVDTGREAQNYNSRKSFGEYMHSKLESFTEAHSNINVIKSYVDDLIYNENKESYTLICNGEKREYDAVFLMTGEMSYSDPYELKGEANFIYNPYPIEEKLNDLDGTIGIIGSGLSAIDSFRYLLLNGRDEVHVLSRSGELPSVRGTGYDIEVEHFTLENACEYKYHELIPLDDLIELFKKELHAQNLNPSLFKRKTDHPEIDLTYDLEHQDEVGKLQYLIIKLQETFNEVFKYLSRADKRTYMEHYHPYIDGNHSPMPQEAARQILKWIDDGKLIFMTGMKEVQTDNGFKVMFEDDKTLHFDILINATGPTENIKDDDTPFLQNMYSRLILEADEFGGILVNKKNEIISPRYGTLKNFYALGAMTAGTNYLIRGVNVLKNEAAELVNSYYDGAER